VTIDSFNQQVINKVIENIKNSKNNTVRGEGESINNFGNYIGNMGVFNDIGGSTGHLNDDSNALSNTLNQLKSLWETEIKRIQVDALERA